MDLSTGNPIVDLVEEVAAKYLLKMFGVTTPTPELIAEAKEPGVALLKAGIEAYDLKVKVKAFKAAGGV